jgi:hypothetical protein
MKTLNKKKNTNHTKKKTNYARPSLKTLHLGFPLYASKKSHGATILEYTKEEEKKYHNACLYGNMSWFGDYEEARHYKTNETNIFQWKIKKPAYLLNMNAKNYNFFKKLFQSSFHSNIQLVPCIKINSGDLEKAKKMTKENNIQNDYLYMSNNEKAYYEFQFAYGYISAEQQYQFMKFVRFLIQHKFIQMETREGNDITDKLTVKINYYFFLNKIDNTKHNRLSIYLFDKHALNNLCMLLPKKYKIEGVFQENTRSFWYPDFIVYKMNIKEYVLFNPHHNLSYVGIVE